MPGWDVQALKRDGTPAAANEMGELAVKLPLPPGALATLWQRDDVYREKYLTRFPGAREGLPSPALWAGYC